MTRNVTGRCAATQSRPAIARASSTGASSWTLCPESKVTGELIKTRPDLNLYVRALNSLEAVELSARLKDTNETKALITEQLVAFVCDSNGNQTFADVAAATEFMKTVRQGVVSKLIRSATSFNNLNDEAIEEELKN